MASKEELQEKNLEELKEMAKDADLKGRSSMSKEELAEALADGGSSEDGDSAELGKDHPASDPAEVKDDLSPSGQEALEEMGEDSAAAEEADLALDASGPLHLQSPSERIMTGAVSEEHAKEQEEVLADMPEDFVGNVSEAGFVEPEEDEEEELSTEQEKRREAQAKLARGEKVEQEDVIDFPPPVEASDSDEERFDPTPGGGFDASAVAGHMGRAFEQKAVFYTDGISGMGDENLERAYEIPELLQSNNPAVREAGDESLSEAAEEEKSGEDKRLAEEVKSGEREDSEDGEN